MIFIAIDLSSRSLAIPSTKLRSILSSWMGSYFR
jgi:hypothetical protein